MNLEITTFRTDDIRIDCPIHGKVKVQSAYDPFLKKMTGISCSECPTITKEVRQLLDVVIEREKNKNTSKVTRFEVIDHTPCEECEGSGVVSVPHGKKNYKPIPKPCIGCGGDGMKGRTVVAHNKSLQFDIELQDDQRTLKVFIHPRYEDDTN